MELNIKLINVPEELWECMNTSTGKFKIVELLEKQNPLTPDYIIDVSRINYGTEHWNIFGRLLSAYCTLQLDQRIADGRPTKTEERP